MENFLETLRILFYVNLSTFGIFLAIVFIYCFGIGNRRRDLFKREKDAWLAGFFANLFCLLIGIILQGIHLALTKNNITSAIGVISAGAYVFGNVIVILSIPSVIFRSYFPEKDTQKYNIFLLKIIFLTKGLQRKVLS